MLFDSVNCNKITFHKNQLQEQRQIGLKVIYLGANTVVGYTQNLDQQGDVGVVARGI
jgi:hypothetical protein